VKAGLGGAPLIRLPETASTNDDAKAGAAHGTVWWAETPPALRYERRLPAALSTRR
jgi:hypothetical protein